MNFELVDWQGLKLPSAERRQRDSLKRFERAVEVWKDWMRLKKELATLGEELPSVELLPAKRKKKKCCLLESKWKIKYDLLRN